jgi:RNA polymerase sigma-70 factor (ECF subfamily)
METAETRHAERVRVAWETHKDRLWRALLAWSHDADIASDAVAEAFAQATRRGDAIDDVGRWVWRAAFRVAAGQLSVARRDAPVDALTTEPTDLTVPEDVALLLDALDRLHPDDRAVIVLAHVGGWTGPEIAELRGTTAGAVRIRLHRARRALRRALEES